MFFFNLGEIKTLEQLDREDIDHYELLVEALDKGTPRRSSQALVKIVVDDVNDEAPKLEVPVNRMIYVPKTGSSLSIGTIIASDKDEKEVLTYQIIGKSEFQQLFIMLVIENISSVSGSNSQIGIDKWTGELKLHSRDAAKNVQNMTIMVKISDSARPRPNSIEEEIAIFFVDEAANELLSVITYTIQVEIQAAIGSNVGKLSTLVSNKDDQFIYKFASNDKLPFYIHGATGDIYVISNLTEFSGKVDTLERDAFIESTSGQTSPVHAKVVFELIDSSISKLRPRFDQDPIDIQVAENLSLGNVVHTMKPVNQRKGDKLTYAMLDQLPNEAFSIEANSGKIKLAKQLDYEHESSFILTVRVTESRSQLSTFVTVLVTVIDVNDNQPLILSSDVVKLAPDVRPNAIFTRIVALDKDQGDNGRLSYQILSGNDDEAFSIDAETGDLSLNKPVIRDYYLRIRVSDHGSPTRLFADQELQVLAMADNLGRPKFLQSPMELSIDENSPAGTTVSALKTLNGAGIPLQYQLLVGDDKFSLDQSSGQLKTQAVLDREEQDSYDLVVSVSDQRFPQFSDTAIIKVNVADVNDNDPVFGASCRDINVPENSQHDYIHTLIAYDKDEGKNGQVQYKLIAGSSSLFSLNSGNGQLSALPLDREKQSSYRLEVIAEDHGVIRSRSASCMITINVMDANDNEPSFSQSIYSASVKEDVPRGTEVLRVLATDLDEGDNAAISYAIENATHNSFTIDKETGSIATTDLLDRELTDSYTFTVVAIDEAKRWSNLAEPWSRSSSLMPMIIRPSLTSFHSESTCQLHQL